jgi:hypothetical protein
MRKFQEKYLMRKFQEKYQKTLGQVFRVPVGLPP